MTRFIIIITLLAQVLAANAAFAAPRCMHADMAAMANMSQMNHSAAEQHANHGGDSQAQEHCKCLCDIVGHCAAASAGVVATVPAAINFPPLSIASARLPTAISSAHKIRLYRPPSST